MLGKIKPRAQPEVGLYFSILFFYFNCASNYIFVILFCDDSLHVGRIRFSSGERGAFDNDTPCWCSEKEKDSNVHDIINRIEKKQINYILIKLLEKIFRRVTRISYHTIWKAYRRASNGFHLI